MNNPRVKTIKHAQRESFFFKEIGNLFMQISKDDPRLQSLSITRAKLSPDRGKCTIYFYIEGGLAAFEEKRPFLILYKPSLRSALSKVVHSRYVPQLVFAFDQQFETQQRVENLLEDLKNKGEL